jgi:hypothetical protein
MLTSYITTLNELLTSPGATHGATRGVTPLNFLERCLGWGGRALRGKL